MSPPTGQEASDRTDQKETPETDQADSNPNAAGPQGLQGDMGISSERTQAPHDERQPMAPDPDDESVEGTGSLASTVGSTDGATPVDPTDHDDDPSAVPPEEPQPDEVRNKHQFDPSRNPGHSHG